MSLYNYGLKKWKAEIEFTFTHTHSDSKSHKGIYQGVDVTRAAAASAAWRSMVVTAMGGLLVKTVTATKITFSPAKADANTCKQLVLSEHKEATPRQSPTMWLIMEGKSQEGNILGHGNTEGQAWISAANNICERFNNETT